MITEKDFCRIVKRFCKVFDGVFTAVIYGPEDSCGCLGVLIRGKYETLFYNGLLKYCIECVDLSDEDFVRFTEYLVTSLFNHDCDVLCWKGISYEFE